MRVRLAAAFAIGGATLTLAGTPPTRLALASAHPVCSAVRITRVGTANTIYTPSNGGYTRFISNGGGTYGVDPNSIPEALWKRLKPNGAAVRVTVEGRTCAGGIFYIERVLEPIATPLLPYSP